MFLLLVVTLIILIILMIVCVGIVNKKVVKNHRRVVQLIWMAVFAVACYTAFILTPPSADMAAALISGLYFLATDWMVVYLMFFSAAYTKMQLPSRLPRRLIGFLAGIDSLSFLVNTFTRHMYDLKMMNGDMAGMAYLDIQFKFPHILHRIFVNGVVLYSLYLFLYRMIKSPSIYKKKYGCLLFQILAVAVLNLLCSMWHTRYDYSVALYATLAISIGYFALYASPRQLLEKIHSTIVGDSVIGLFAYDNEGNCVGVNRAAEEFFAGRGEIYQFAEQYLKDWLEETKELPSSAISVERTVEQNGETFYLYVTYQKFSDEKRRSLGSCFRFENRTSVVEKFQEERYRATHDMLTGLLNREAFEAEVRRILAGSKEPYCIVCSNIQDFKLINELYGTDAGDRILVAQARMIRGEEEENSVSARVYADKFCTLLPRRSFNEQMFMENMNGILNLGEESSFKPHFYLGVYEITDVNEPVWTMYDKAMLAIHSIRGNYGQCVCFYKDELLRHVMEEREVLGGFDKAIEEEQFKMFLQPQLDGNGRIMGAEALVRWMHPKKGMLNPGLFIPVLEKGGLIHRLDMYMWESAAKKLAEWRTQGREDLSISVNISTKDFFYLDICKIIQSLKEKYDFDIKNLKLEITESALVENIGEIMKTLDGLHLLGCDIEIDDFGSGYSSLGILKDINADILKMDMVFIQETENMIRSTTILKNVISMSRELGMPIIMEGVETKEQVDFLKEAGCDMFQGYYFAKPMSVENFEKEYC